MANDLQVPELTEEEVEDSVEPLAHIFLAAIRYSLTTGKLDKADLASVYRSELAKLKKKYSSEQANKILKAAANSIIHWFYQNNVDSFKKDGSITAALNLHFMHNLRDLPPQEVQNTIAGMIADFGRTNTWGIGKSQEHILKATGIDVDENDTALFTRLYYELRKKFETKEEKRNRRYAAGKSGKHIDDVVAEELDIEVPALKKRLRKAK